MAQLVEFIGKDLEEAIASAAASLNLPPEKVKFSLLTMGSKGFLGLGRRKARISVDPADPALSLGGEEKASKEPSPPAAARPDKTVLNTAELSQKSDEAGSGASQDNRDKRPPKADKPSKVDKLPKTNKPPKAARLEKPAAEDRKKAPVDGQAGPAETVEVKALDWAHVPPPLTQPGPGETELANSPDDQTGQMAEAVVREIIGRMGLEVQCRRLRIGSRLVITLDSPDNALLIGNRGSTLEAIQLLAAKIFLRRSKSTEATPGCEDRLILDVADYRSRRQAQLLENLRSLAEEARSSRQPQALGGLNPAERRLVMLALRPFKDLIITPGGGRDGLTITVAAGQRAQRPPRPRRPHRPRRGPKQSS